MWKTPSLRVGERKSSFPLIFLGVSTLYRPGYDTALEGMTTWLFLLCRHCMI